MLVGTGEVSATLMRIPLPGTYGITSPTESAPDAQTIQPRANAARITPPSNIEARPMSAM